MLLFFIYTKPCYGKRVLNILTLGVGFCFDSEIKHFPVSSKLYKMYVADQTPQTMVLFFPVLYAKVCYRQRRLIDKLDQKIHKC